MLQTVGAILRKQAAVPETVTCGKFIEQLRHDPNQLIVPIVNVNGETIGLIDRQTVLTLAANPLHYSVLQNRRVTSIMDAKFFSFDVDESIENAAATLVSSGVSLSAGGFLVTQSGTAVGVAANTDTLNHLVELNQARAKQLEDLNSELLDSVNYASRIQASLLPSSDHLSQALRSAAVIWEPRDIVGGDVYWRTEVDDSGVFSVALIDCTGHGVPGALMSMLVISTLNHIFDDQPKIGPGAALALLGNLVRRALNQDTDNSQSNDGFDAGLCKFDLKAGKLYYAAARTNCFVIPKSREPIFRLTGTHQALGYAGKEDYQALEEIEIDLTEVDSIVMVSDGILDQPGGHKRIAFGAKRLQALLDDAHGDDAVTLIQKLQTAISTWREFEVRRDDVSAVALSI
jgi:serine phosphatase RsbU (regulator of sigma subunit)